MATKLGHTLAKVLGIKLQYRDPTGDHLTRGESVFSVSSADTYIEEEPTSVEWIREIAPTGETFLHWAYNLFPFTHWIGRYNLQWLAGDLIAGMYPLFSCCDYPAESHFQVSRSAVSLSLSPWHTPAWLNLSRNLAFTRPSWAF